MVACPGAWKNFEEIEDCLSLPELLQILDSFREMERERFKFQAALQGVDLDSKSGNEDSDFEEVKRRALSKTTGISEEVLELNSIGITVEEF